MSNFLTTTNGGRVLGGGFQGIAPKQSVLNYKAGGEVISRKTVVKSWNTPYAAGNVNGRKRVTTPFRAVTNSGDYLGRVQYSCGGPNGMSADKPGWKSRIRNMLSNCDGSGVPASATNVRFVADSSDYAKFRRNRAINLNYNDLKFGGDQANATQVPRDAVRRF